MTDYKVRVTAEAHMHTYGDAKRP